MSDHETDHPDELGISDEGASERGYSGIVPYKNGMSLASYYTSVAALIPILGLLLAPLAIIFAILGLRTFKQDPRKKGRAHAIVALVLSTIVLAIHGYFFFFVSKA